MTQDLIALTPSMPDVRTILAGLYAGGPDLHVDRVFDGAAVQLCARDGRPLVTVEVPVLVQVPGEVRRLLGAEARATEEPVWWTEVRATTAVAEAGRLAGSVAGRLIAVLGGTAWPADTVHTDVVAIPGMDGTTADRGPFDIDVLTDQGALVIQDRPVIAATSWLTNLMQSTVGSARELQIVTPPETRLTLPVRTLLANIPARWVVRDPTCGYYDGLTGAILRWHEGRFVRMQERAAVAAAFVSNGDARDERQLHLSLHAVHPADEHLLLGGVLEAAGRALTGAPPVGWSTAEPVNQPWSPRQGWSCPGIRPPQIRVGAVCRAGSWTTGRGDP
ncbi:DUF6177 family protein [Streptomyces sp. TP-A0356]|uniref:DUF6177 family protein n=1 Tax=Streptomyces sp. TP-A0356 TaxID=1359208 RepID=UPI0006E1B4AB|nr:DUF6177 family protein [Streptomyces sp. TP-A0356]